MSKATQKQQELQIKQTQTEALVRLMLLARYQDKKLSLSEQEAFNRSLQKLSWHSVTDISMFTMKETAAVRRALESPEQLQSFVRQQCAHFKTDSAKTECLTILKQIAKVDGLEQHENQFIQQVEASFESVVSA